MSSAASLTGFATTSVVLTGAPPRANVRSWLVRLCARKHACCRLFEEVVHGATARPLDTGKRNVRQDASQDVVEIVRDAAREQTQALELLMAQALIGDLALERNVTQHEDCAAPSLVRALQRRGLH